ncbi:MAG: DUF1573 domain-containing protein [Limisphaerales bacterium]
MKKLFHFIPLICLSALSLIFIAAQEPPTAAPAPQAPAARPHALTWDAMEKTYHAEFGETSAPFTYWVTNTSTMPVLISSVNPSCGCTVADYPKPWNLAPGESGEIKASMNFAGKTGIQSKIMSVISSGGPQQTLTMRVVIPHDTNEERRKQNMAIAAKDRQAVFKNDCASCHVEPLKGKRGQELFVAGCNICHDPYTGHRAEIVPDLKKLAFPTDRNFWKKIITEGKEGTLMPGFGQAHGGPLTEEEIDSLVDYALEAFPFNPENIKIKITN